MKTITARQLQEDFTPEQREALQAWIVGEERNPKDVYQIDLNDDGTATWHQFIRDEHGYRIMDTPTTVATIVIYNIPIEHDPPSLP